MKSTIKRQKRDRGEIVMIPLGNDQYAFGHVLKRPLFAFYAINTKKIPPIDEITASPILFKIWVMDYAVTRGEWPVIGAASVSHIDENPCFCKRDALSGALTIIHSGAEKGREATIEECLSLEPAAVWEPSHVIDRLRDHFAGRPNKWLESMRRTRARGFSK